MSGQFLITIGDVSQIPVALRGEFLQGHRERRIAFVGRSNVGKSSLINEILGSQLARVSQNPGKTRSIHFYLWKEGKKILTDLPGYGFAKVSAEERDRWKSFIDAYLENDAGLERTVVLLDSRCGPTPLDCDAIRFLSFLSVPVTFVFTKSDTMKTQSERARRRKESAEVLRELGFDPESAFWVSSRTKDGLKPLMDELKRDAPPTRTDSTAGAVVR